MTKKLEDILSECIDHLLRGKSIEDCLKDYPERAGELEPLLKVSWQTAQQTSSISPDPQLKARGRYRLQEAVHAGEPGKKKAVPLIGWVPRWAIVVLVLVILFSSFGGTVAAATSSQPDQFLYPLKLATEQVRLTLTFSKVDKAKLHAKFAQMRAEEIAYVAGKGEDRQVEKLMTRLENHLEEIKNLAERMRAEDRAEIRRALVQSAAKSWESLELALAKAPALRKPALEQLAQRVEGSYQEALERAEALAIP